MSKRIQAKAKSVQRAKTTPGEEGRKYVTTTVRLFPRQWDALRRAAMQRALDAKGGDEDPRKPDASKIVRELLDDWIAKGAK
jgi:hypothetical protein